MELKKLFIQDFKISNADLEHTISDLPISFFRLNEVISSQKKLKLSLSKITNNLVSNVQLFILSDNINLIPQIKTLIKLLEQNKNNIQKFQSTV